MKAWLIAEGAGLSGLHLHDVPEPVAGPEEVVLELLYAGLNPADRYLAEGQYPAKPLWPHILGRDGVGKVVAMGPGVTEVQPGELRAILRGAVGVDRAGTFAEKVVVPVRNLVEIPTNWTERQAAGATLVYLTAYQALSMWGAMPPSAVVLVTGASGGVGTASVHLAKAMGHTVVALSRNIEKSRKLIELGADFTFNPENPKWRQELKTALQPRRVDLAIDNIGGKLLSELIDTLGDHGRVSLVGRLAGPVPNFNTASLFFRRLRLGGVAAGAYTNEESRDAWQQVLTLLAKTGVRPLVDKVFPFDELPAAFNRLSEGPMGKVLLAVKGTI